MLLTDASWAEPNSVRSALAKPFHAWRCMGWTDESPSFLVICTRDQDGNAPWPDSWMVDGPETLLDVVPQLEASAIAVYVLDRTEDGVSVEINRVTGIWREQDRASGARGPWFWYTTDGGEMKPCTRGQLAHGNGMPASLVNELALSK